MSIPGPPTNCTVEVVSHSTVKFSWSPPSALDSSVNPITNYKLIIVPTLAIDNYETQPLEFMIEGTLTEYIVQGLLCNVEFKATLQASIDNGATFGEEGQFTLFTIAPGQPSAPSEGGYMYVSPTEVTLAWKAPSDTGGIPLTNYCLTLQPILEGSTPVLHELDASIQSFSVKDIQYGVPIQATLKASNNNKESYGPEFTFPLIVSILPPSSSPVSAEVVVLDDGVVEVSWTAPPNPIEGKPYYLVLSKSSNPNDPIVGYGTMDLTQTSCRLAELNRGSDYFFTVEIVNQVGKSTPTVTNTVRPFVSVNM